MARGFAHECIKRTQDWVALWLAVHESLIETVQIFCALSPVQDIVDAGADCSDEADPHLGRAIREVGIAGAEHSHTNGHVRADGRIPVHRKIAIDGFMAAFSIQ